MPSAHLLDNPLSPTLIFFPSPFPLHQHLMLCVYYAHLYHHFSSAHPNSGNGDEGDDDMEEEEGSAEEDSTLPPQLSHPTPSDMLKTPSTNTHYTRGPLTQSLEQAMLLGLTSNRLTYSDIQTLCWS